MNIKLDENLPASLADALSELGHNAATVPGEGLTGQRDADIWEAAQSERRFLVTQDLDFSDIRRYAPGTHHGILLARLRDPGRKALFSRIMSIFETELVESWRGCFVVVTEHKVRVRRPR